MPNSAAADGAFPPPVEAEPLEVPLLELVDAVAGDDDVDVGVGAGAGLIPNSCLAEGADWLVGVLAPVWSDVLALLGCDVLPFSNPNSCFAEGATAEPALPAERVTVDACVADAVPEAVPPAD